MEKGPDGFIIGKFGKHVVVLDAPNLMLASAKDIKKRPAAAINKKPAAADESVEKKKTKGKDATLWDTPKQAHDLTLLTLEKARAHPMCRAHAMCIV